MADKFVIQKEFIENLYKAAFHFFPYYPVKFDIDKSSFGSLTFDEFSDQLQALTGTTDINTWFKSLEEFKLLTPSQLESNRPTLEQIEHGMKLSEETKAAKEHIEEKVKVEEKAREKKLKEIYAKAKIEKPRLPVEKQANLAEVAAQIKNASTEEEIRETIDTLANEIKSRVEEIPEPTAQITAALIVANVKTDFKPTIDGAAIQTLAEKPEYKDLSAILSDPSKTTDELRQLASLTQNAAKAAFGEEFQKEFIPDMEVEVSDVPQAGFVPIQIPYIPRITPSTSQTETIAFGQTWVQIQLAGIEEGVIQGTNYNPKAFQSSLSIFKPLTGLAKQAAVNKVSGLVTKAVIEGAGVAAGPETFFLSILASKATTAALDLLSKVQRSLKEHPEYAVFAGALLISPIFFFGVSPLTIISAILGVGTVGSGIGAASSTIVSSVGSALVNIGGAIASATLGAIGIPILATLLAFPVVVALILFIINSGAYIVPPGTSTGTVSITCNTTQNNGQSLPSPENTAADAAVCIVSYLNQFRLNPLFKSMLNSPAWKSLASVLPAPALDELAKSAPVDGHLQCVGFVSATAGLAYGKGFTQINACSYINHAPAGYKYIDGTRGMKSGDFFIIDGKGGCSSSSPGHIGVVVSVDGALISCADANMVAPGKSRVAHGCFALSQIAGYLRKQ